MTSFSLLATFCGSILLGAVTDGEAVPRCEAWRTQYTGESLTGEHVIAAWNFDRPHETEDASGRGHSVQVQDASFHEGGRFGDCLESFRGWPQADQRHRGLVADADDLSPRGGFSLEMWICAKPELDNDYPDAFLLDKKYVSDHDYQLVLGRADRVGNRTLVARLGFGLASAEFHSNPLQMIPGCWHHIAFTYDGDGRGSFYLDGQPWGDGTAPGSGSIAPGRHPLSIGDRVGSLYHGFPGYIDQVRICSGVREFREFRIRQLSPRRVFVRMEDDVQLQLDIVNLTHQALAEASLRLQLDDEPAARFSLNDLPSGGNRPFTYALDTSLRPGPYRLSGTIELADQTVLHREELPLRIVPRHPPHRFPVVMWGGYDNTPEQTAQLRQIGFTHVLGLRADDARIWAAGKPTTAHELSAVEANQRMLDQALAEDLTIVANLSPGAAMRREESLLRVDRQGQPIRDREDVCGLIPRLGEYCFDVGASVAETYGEFPALGAAMLHTEVRDHARPCFHPHDLAEFRAATGLEIPPEVLGPRGVDYGRLADFPASRVIPESYPLYQYYRWYWKQGDGWNRLTSQLHAGLKSTGREDLWTFHDPAVRVASVYGSGGDVDVLSQWTYSYPDPIRIGLATDELLAMARGASPPKQVMKMTQIIWYRSQTAPEPKSPDLALPYQAGWERQQPEAPFITIPPAHLRAAFWTKIARPVRGIMYHGWQSLVPTKALSSYRYTHPETQSELTRLIQDVVEPLGPTLLQVPPVRSEIAFLKSFASEMFAKRGTFGWSGGWAGDCYLVLAYAHWQPEIVFEETLVQHGLGAYRILVMPDCDVLTEPVVREIQRFQQTGGVVIGDPRTCPAIHPDYIIPDYARTGHADADQRALLERAEALRREFFETNRPLVDSDHPHVIPHRRRYGTTDYIFLVNDHREFGGYVGQHGRVMEQGLPSRASISVQRSGGHVYDLLSGQELPVALVDGRLTCDAELGPCAGRLWMITDRAIDRVEVDVPDLVQRGDSLMCEVRVLDAASQPLDAVIPVAVTIVAPEGREAEFSGYHAAVDGRLNLPIAIATNDPFGVWQVTVRERASGCAQTAYFTVRPPEPWPPTLPAPDQPATEAEQPGG